MTATILDQIFAHKRTEVERQKLKIPQAKLEQQLGNAPKPRSLRQALRQPDRISLIAEVKKASPSKGVFLENFNPTELAETYASNGAAAISVLTDVRFFQGSLIYLRSIHEHLDKLGYATPLLRKDFLYDPYQIYEARVSGADAILLIVGMLDDQTLHELYQLTYGLGMEALVEVHTEAEMARAQALQAQIIGINNRDLHSFSVDIATTQRVSASLPAIGDPQRPVLVAESGIHGPDVLPTLREWGVDSILVGESIVLAPDHAAHVRALSQNEQRA